MELERGRSQKEMEAVRHLSLKTPKFEPTHNGNTRVGLLGARPRSVTGEKEGHGGIPMH